MTFWVLVTEIAQSKFQNFGNAKFASLCPCYTRYTRYIPVTFAQFQQLHHTSTYKCPAWSDEFKNANIHFLFFSLCSSAFFAACKRFVTNSNHALKILGNICIYFGSFWKSAVITSGHKYKEQQRLISAPKIRQQYRKQFDLLRRISNGPNLILFANKSNRRWMWIK